MTPPIPIRRPGEPAAGLVRSGMEPNHPDRIMTFQALELTPAEQAGATPLRVLEELMRIATFDIGMLYDGNGQLLPIHLMPEEARRAISSIEVDEIIEGKGEDARMVGVTRKVKTWDKLRSLDTIARHLGMLLERVKLEVDDDLADAVRKARLRADAERRLPPSQETP